MENFAETMFALMYTPMRKSFQKYSVAYFSMNNRVLFNSFQSGGWGRGGFNMGLKAKNNKTSTKDQQL